MPLGPRYILLIALLLQLLAFTCAVHYPKIVYASQYCGKAVNVDTEIRLQLNEADSFIVTTTCEVYIYPTSGRQLIVKFLNYKVPVKSPTEDSFFCPLVKFELYDANSVRQIVHEDLENCGSNMSHTNLLLLGASAKLRFIARDNPKVGAVDMLLTEVLPEMEKACIPQFFRCESSKLCVPEQVQCNGFNNCADGEDELKCVSSMAFTKSRLALLAFAFLCVYTIVS